MMHFQVNRIANIFLFLSFVYLGCASKKHSIENYNNKSVVQKTENSKRSQINSDKIVLAVANLEANGDKANESLHVAFAQMLTSDLARSDDFIVVERSQLKQIFKELELQKSTWIDQETAVELGKGLGAEFLVVGQVVRLENQLNVDLRVIDTSTSQIVTSVSDKGLLEDFFQIEKNLASSLLTTLGAKLSPIARKRLGSGGTKNADSIKLWAKGLKAIEDGRQKDAEISLQQAVNADPEFRLAKKVLDELTQRVEVLEKSGGLIINPRSWRENIHNFNIHLSNGRYDESLKSLKNAVNHDPQRVEVLSLLKQLPKAYLTEDLSILDDLSSNQKDIIVRWFKNNLSISSLIKKDGFGLSDKVLICLLSLVDIEHKVRYSFADMDQAAQMISFFAGVTAEGLLYQYLLDPPLFNKRLEKLKANKLSPEYLRAWRASSVEAINPNQSNMRTSLWDLNLRIPDQIKSNVQLTLYRNENHPHWDINVLSFPEMHRFSVRSLSRISRRMDTKKEWLWLYRSTKKVTPFGRPITLPSSIFDCYANDYTPTKTVCSVTLKAWKGSLTPGPYRVKLEWVDGSGKVVSMTNDYLWVNEFSLRASSWNGGGVMGTYKMVWPLNPRRRFSLRGIREPRDKPIDEKWMWNFEVCAHEATVRTSSRPTIHYDWNYRLSEKKVITNNDITGWQKYLERIIDKGESSGLHRVCQEIVLPELSPGTHKVCFVAMYGGTPSGGEPECLTVEIPHDGF